MYSGISPPTSHATIPLGSRIASTYFFPAERSDAAICVTSNQG